MEKWEAKTGVVFAGSSQNQCQELLLLVEIVNLLVVPGSDLDQDG